MFKYVCAGEQHAQCDVLFHFYQYLDMYVATYAIFYI